MGKVEYSITPKSIRIVIALFSFLVCVSIYLYFGHRTTSPPPATCFDLGLYNIHKGEPAYLPRLDRDGDGVACEK